MDATYVVTTDDAAITAARTSEAENAFYPDTELRFAKLLEVPGIAKPERTHFEER